jgi:hypothetical protein
MARAKIVAPTLLKIGLDLVERSSVVIRVHARDVAELIRRANVVVTSVRKAVTSLLEALAEV